MDSHRDSRTDSGTAVTRDVEERRPAEERVIATTNRARQWSVFRRAALSNLILLVLVLVTVPANDWFYRLINRPPSALQQWTRVSGWGAIALIAWMFVALLIGRCERLIAVDGHDLVFWARRRRLGSVDLRTIDEIVIRQTGSWTALGADRGGLGLILSGAGSRGLFGHRRRVLPRLNFWLSGFHTIITMTYNETAEQIAFAISDAVQAARGFHIPVRSSDAPGRGKVLLRGADSPTSGAMHSATLPSIACVSCGYDLRLLPLTASCPECGTPAVRSLAGERLEYADRAWLRSLELGCLLNVLAALIATWVAATRLHEMVMAFVHRTLTWRAVHQFEALTVTTVGIGSLGLMLFTRYSPQSNRVMQDVPTRRLARFVAVLPWILIALWLARVPRVRWMIPSGFGLSLLLSWGMLTWYARHVAARAGMRYWHRIFMIVGFVYLLSAVIGAAFGATLLLNPRLLGPATAQPPNSALTPELAARLMTLGLAGVILPVAIAFAPLWLRIRAIRRMAARDRVGESRAAVLEGT